MARAIGLCVLYSLAIETLQFFGLPSGRVASVSDVLTNSFGAVVGATVARDWRLVVLPQPSMAEWLATLWTVMCVAVFIASGWAVSSPPVGVGRATIKVSPLPFIPGFGWFAGTVTRATVNGVEIPRGGSGNGPVIVAASGLKAASVHLEIVGRDSRVGEVPMLYVHPDSGFLPALVLSQDGSGLSLRVASRGERVGMTPLTLVLRDVLTATPDPAPLLSASGEIGGVPTRMAGGPTGGLNGVAARSAAELTVEARSTPELLELVASGDSAVLLRTATTGWALIQSLVPVSDVSGGWLTGVWLAGLMFPLSFWGWCGGSRRVAVTAMAALASAAAILTTVPLFGISRPPYWQWVVCAAALAAGALAAQFASSRRVITE